VPGHIAQRLKRHLRLEARFRSIHSAIASMQTSSNGAYGSHWLSSAGLAAHQLTWRGYMEDMPAPCTHPALNTQDQTQTAKPGDQYAAPTILLSISIRSSMGLLAPRTTFL
jgi:hypothetical protein